MVRGQALPGGTAPFGRTVGPLQVRALADPLSYDQAARDDDSGGVIPRPALKCPGCGEMYEWKDSANWVPYGTAVRPKVP